MPNDLATPQTQWFTGSTTKAFTASAVAQLIRDQSIFPGLAWSTPLSEIIRDEFVLQDGYASTHITLEDALSHRSGMPRHDLSYGSEGESSETIVRNLRHLPTTAEPRTEWQYCNLMYAAVGRCLESLTKMPLEKILRQNFWKPLGMQSTTFNVSEAANPTNGPSRLARGYFWDSSRAVYVPDQYVDLLPIAGAGATISTVEDYALWMKALLAAASGHDNTSSPISPSMFRDLVTPRSVITSPGSDEDIDSVTTPPLYSLGWLSTKLLNEAIVTHDGGLTGFGAFVCLVPGRDYGIVMMGNTAGTSNVAESVIASRLLVSLLRGKEAETTAQIEVQAVFKRTMQVHSPSWTGKQIVQEEDNSFDALDSSYFSDESSSHSPNTKLPFPGGNNASATITGVYSHPAYGIFNLTFASSVDEANNGTLTLETYLYPRTWPVKLVFTHTSHTVFHLATYSIHGLSDDVLGIKWEDTVLERYPIQQKAVFELDLYGKKVACVGLEMEPSMVDAAAAKRSKGKEMAWKDGMIWFEKL